MLKLLGRIWMGCVYAFLYIPILVVIVYSFNNGRYSTSWKGFTLRWYGMLADNGPLLDSVLNSLSVACLSATLATALGVLAAVCIRRYRFAGKGLFHATLYVLTVSPEIVMGISLLMFFIVCNIPLGFLSVLIAHTTLALPFAAVTVLARLSEFDESLLEAARDLGASEWKAFKLVMLPIIRPGVLAGWLLSFTLSMDDVLISFFVTSPSFEILPLRIYSMVRLGVKPDINALSAIMFGVTVAVIMIAWFFGTRSGRKRS